MTRRVVLAAACAAAVLTIAVCGVAGVSVARDHKAPRFQAQEISAALVAAPISVENTEPGIVVRTTGTDTVALTFDDGPDASTPRILALLRQYGVKATFCLIGVNVEANPGLVQEIVRDGHTLCNHTWRHDARLGTRSAQDIRDDLRRTNDAIRRAVPNAVIKYFRHPAGNFTEAAISVARDMGMVSLGWNVDTRDWDTSSHPPGDDLTNYVISMVKQNCAPGSIVLSHDGGGNRSSTEAAYRTLLPYLKERYHLIAMPA